MKYFLNWFRRAGLEQSLDRELRYHFDRRVNELMEAGRSLAEAQRQARLELGGLSQVREEVRDVWLTRWLRDFAYDLRFSARSFLRNTAFTSTVVVSLALGIGTTTAIYSLVDQVLLHELPVQQPERLVLVDWQGEQAAPGFGSFNLMSYPLCLDLQQQSRIFAGVMCRAATAVNLSTGGQPQPAAAEIVSHSYFSMLGVAPAMGRFFTDDDDRTSNPVVVLSHDFWRNQLASAPGVLGRKLLVNQHPMTVIGVATPSFRGIDVGEVPALWIPAALSAKAIPGFESLLDRRMRWMQILGRLQPGVTLVEAKAGLAPWFQAMLQEDTRRAGFPVVTPEVRRNFLASTLELTPAAQGHSSLRRRLAQPLWVLLAATSVLLALACLNVAGLFLAQGSAREREISTRLALGASSGRLGRQLIADSLLLALVGGLFGLFLAPLALRALIAFLPRNAAANALNASVDLRLLWFALSLSVAVGLLSGFAPALHAGRRALISSLRERGGSALSGTGLRKAIVTGQIAFTLILVIGAALFVKTLTGLLAKGPGFTTSSLVSLSVNPLRNGSTRGEAELLMRRLRDALQAAPIARTTSVAAMQLLGGGSWNNPITIQTNERSTTDRTVHLNAVSPGFFAAIGAQIIAGRDFDMRDSNPGPATSAGRRTAIVNAAFAKRYLAGRSPLGARIAQGSGPDVKPDTEVIGVVSDFNYRGLRDESEQAYFPFVNETRGTFYIRVQGPPEAAFPVLREVVRRIDPSLPITDFRTVDEQISRSLITERLLATLSGSFGLLALVLSLVGLYGVMSFVVTQRTREIGIRLALGATPASTIRLVLRDAVVMIGAGTAIALPCIWALGRLVESQLYGVQPTDPAALAAAVSILSAAALGAALIPAYRASRVKAVEALRCE